MQTFSKDQSNIKQKNEKMKQGSSKNWGTLKCKDQVKIEQTIKQKDFVITIQIAIFNSNFSVPFN